MLASANFSDIRARYDTSFRTGQSVRLRSSIRTRSAAGGIHGSPGLADNGGETQYRIKSGREAHERVVNEATWNQSELIPQRVPCVPNSDNGTQLVNYRRRSLPPATQSFHWEPAFSGEAEQRQKPYLAIQPGRDSSKRNDKFDRQVPNVPNRKLTDAHERNPTVCSTSFPT